MITIKSTLAGISPNHNAGDVYTVRRENPTKNISTDYLSMIFAGIKRIKKEYTITTLTPKLSCYQGYGCLFLALKKPMPLCQLGLQMKAGEQSLRKFPLLHLWRSAVETGTRLDQRERAGSMQLPRLVQKRHPYPSSLQSHGEQMFIIIPGS
jgi:hypothetical protein